MKKLLFILLFPACAFSQPCLNVDCTSSGLTTDSFALNVTCSVPLAAISWKHISCGTANIDNANTASAWTYNLAEGWNVYQVTATTAAGQVLTAQDTIFVTLPAPAPIVQTVTVTVPAQCPVPLPDRTVTGITELPGGIKQILFNRGAPQSY